MSQTVLSFDGTETAEYLLNTVTNPSISAVGGEWTVFGLLRNDFECPDGYFSEYVENAKKEIRLKNGVLDERKYTEYSRVVLTMSALGYDPKNISGYDLLAPLLDFEKTSYQGLNGNIWALIALDSVKDFDDETNIKQKNIDKILSRQNTDGGFSLNSKENTSDIDITSMAVTALSNHKDDEKVRKCLDSAVEYLLSSQNENGGFSSFGEENSETCSQVIIALCSYGSDKDNGILNNMKNNLLSYKSDDGSFFHSRSSKTTNIMSTEQAFLALTSLSRLYNDKPALFDISDTKSIKEQKKDIIANVPKKITEKYFSDISSSSEQNAILSLAKRGILNGKTENEFCPDDYVTRAEFCAILTRAFGISSEKEIDFSDVFASSWYYNYVKTLYGFGIINGTGNNLFSPEKNITREQAMLMLYRSSYICGLKTDEKFINPTDSISMFFDYKTVSDWALNGVSFCSENKILNDDNLNIRPNENATRGEIAQMVYNLLYVSGLIWEI